MYDVKMSNAASNAPTRHQALSFTDGTIAVLAGNSYFLVHKGFLARHSQPLASAIKAQSSCRRLLEGRPVLNLPDTADDMYHFLVALYDGM
jgi:hypothetical protein